MEVKTCGACRGTGEMTVAKETGYSGKYKYRYSQKSCADCNGKGWTVKR